MRALIKSNKQQLIYALFAQTESGKGFSDSCITFDADADDYHFICCNASIIYLSYEKCVPNWLLILKVTSLKSIMFFFYIAHMHLRHRVHSTVCEYLS
jgi:hypothetical protein